MLGKDNIKSFSLSRGCTVPYQVVRKSQGTWRSNHLIQIHLERGCSISICLLLKQYVTNTVVIDNVKVVGKIPVTVIY